MEYTTPILALCGLLGILINNLMKLNRINRQSSGRAKLGEYLALEIYSILISACVLGAALIARNEITQFEYVSKWMALSFLTLGYMAQSIVVGFMGRAEKIIKTKTDMADELDIREVTTLPAFEDAQYGVWYLYAGSYWYKGSDRMIDHGGDHPTKPPPIP